MLSDHNEAKSRWSSSDEEEFQPNPTRCSKENDIDRLERMCEKGLISKKDLSTMILAVLKQNSRDNSQRKSEVNKIRGKSKSKEDLAEGLANSVLQQKKVFRRSASPETKMIRKVICFDIRRRFEKECSKPNSVLFTDVRPQRLKEDVFLEAARSPMKKIYTTHAKKLKDVAGGKVVNVVKWKIRKMRANKTPSKCVISDGFDFELCARKLRRKSFDFRSNSVAVDLSADEKAVVVDPSDDHQSVVDFSVVSQPSTPNKMKTSCRSAFTPVGVGTVRGQGVFRKCCKCGIQVSCIQPPSSGQPDKIAYPTDINWLVNTGARSYCQKHYQEKTQEMDVLILQDGYSKKNPRKRTVSTCMY